MSQLKRCVRRRVRCGAGEKKLKAVRVRVCLARGYRAMGRLNSAIAEECLASDNDALSAAEQILTECEQK